MCTLEPLRGCALLLAFATLPDAATAASRATQRCCNALRRCNFCFQGHATLQQRSWALQPHFWIFRFCKLWSALAKHTVLL